MQLIPKKFFLAKGKGSHRSKLLSFEEALRDAGIEKFNLVKVSSIIPPNCIEVTREEGLKDLHPGQIIFVVLSKTRSNKLNKLLSAAIGIAKPKNARDYGYLSEYHSYDIKSETIGKFVEVMAAEMLATTHGTAFNIKEFYNKKKPQFRIKNTYIEIKNYVSSGIVKNENEWMTVLVAAILIV